MMSEQKPVNRVADDLGHLDFITDAGQLERYSRDFSWFSPVLVDALAGKVADAVVRPKDEEEVKRVMSSCVRHQVPLTLRGSGTGNYGQSTPLRGGVVMDMSKLDAVQWVRGPVARVQSGARLVNIDKETKRSGWELRLLPSTYRLATAGGFYCGGFGGVGSITYGSIGDPGNVLGVRALSMEAEPRVVELRDREARDIYHAYGVNGVVTELEFALGPAHDWREALLIFPDFMSAVKFGQTLGNASGIVKKLLTVLADPLPQMCGLAKTVPAGWTAVPAIVTATDVEALHAMCSSFGGKVALEQVHAEVYGTPKTLIEYTWNHTTLHILKKDKGITYLQSGFRPWENIEKVEEMHRHFGDEVMMHLEFLRADGALTCSGLQVIRYSTEERLNEIIQYHRDNGVHVANPHTYLLEDGNKGDSDPRQVEMKRRLDPLGLLNPGKMRAWNEEAAA